MELSFPCAGNIDDGLFNIDPEGGGDGSSGGDGRQWRATPTCDSGDSSLLSPQQNCQSKVLSPDALDLALMAFDVTASEEEEEEEDGGGGVSSNTRDIPLSPFCDAAIHQRGSAVTRTRPDEARAIAPDCTGCGALWGTTAMHNRCSTPSPGAVPMGWPSAKAQHRGGFSKAFPPRLTVGHDGSSNPGTHLVPEHPHRVGEVWRRFPGHQPVRRLITDVHAQSRWARERAETREAVASSVRKEEKALAVVDRAAVACLNGMNGGVKVKTETDSAEKRRVSFVDDAECGSLLSLPSPGTRDATSEDDRNEKTQTAAAAPAPGKEKDELLARASDLHSSVAGQLRSVNELLKRKSYFYIDTSWSARQLPYPPTAWKGQGLGGPTSDGHGEGGVGTDASAICRITPSADRNQPAALSDANNGVLKLDGRWAAAGSRKPKVGFYSIPGEKAHDPSWKTQDAGMAIAPFDRREKQALFAVFDGHGINGRQASRQCMERLPKYLASASRSGDPASALRRSCQRLHRDLVTGVAGDCTRSGTTLCVAVLTGRRLTVANVGDSGCLRLSRAAEDSSSGRGGGGGGGGGAAAAADTGGGVMSEIEADRSPWRRRENVGHETTAVARELVVERVSRDHKPECSGELERIEAAGGVVFPLPCRTGGGGGTSGSGTATAPPGPKYGEPPGGRDGGKKVRDFGAEISRVWKAGGGGPGLAMSRSIGDKMAHSVGVTHEPDIAEIDLDPRNDVMLVMATDGVWDVLSVEDIRKVAESHVADDTWCPQALAMEICRKSLSGWATATTGGSDDISCLVVKTSGIFPTRRTSSPVATKTQNGKN